MKFSQADSHIRMWRKTLTSWCSCLLKKISLNSVAMKASRFVSTRMKLCIATKHQMTVAYNGNESVLLWMLYSPSKICQYQLVMAECGPQDLPRHVANRKVHAFTSNWTTAEWHINNSDLPSYLEFNIIVNYSVYEVAVTGLIFNISLANQ
jgi:hypothetical protein